MSEIESSTVENISEVLLSELPKELDADGNEINANIDWEKAENEFGTVEFKLYRSENNNGKVILYLPGLGGAVEHFEQRFAKSLTDQGYDVATIRRNGTIINADNHGAINSAERVALGSIHEEEHFGKLAKYGYKEWTQEMACAAVSLDERYQEFQIIGSSFGGLIGLESIRQLQEKRPTILSKISRFVALSGQIGPVSEGEDGNLFLDQATNYRSVKFLKHLEKLVTRNGGCRMKDPSEIVDESLIITNRIYNPETKLPNSVLYSTISAEGDEYFSLDGSISLRKKIESNGGVVQVWHNRSELPDPFIEPVEDADETSVPANPHGQRKLTPKALLAILSNPASDQRLKIIRHHNPLGPNSREIRDV